MSLKQKVQLVARAAAFATIAIGGLSAGLSITTYTVAKANDMVFPGATAAARATSLDLSSCS